MTENLSLAIEKITKELRARHQTEITGALLGELIRRVAPELNVRDVMQMPTGPGALSRFVDKYLDKILTKIRKQGSDQVYLINSATPLLRGNIDPELWRTFVRPTSTHLLLVRDSELVLEKKDGFDPSRPENKLVVESASHSELDKIRENFVTSGGKELEDLPGVTEPYAAWSMALRKKGQRHYRSWTEYRLQKITELFSKRLEELGIVEELRYSLSNIMRHSQLATQAFRIATKVQSTEGTTTQQTLSSKRIEPPDFDLRAAIIEVIRKLPTEKLRELRLPNDALFDAIAANFTKSQP